MSDVITSPGDVITSPSGAPDTYEVYYNDLELRQNVRVTVPAYQNSLLLDDLTPDTVYFIRMTARSRGGQEGPSSPLIQVKTLDTGQLLG